MAEGEKCRSLRLKKLVRQQHHELAVLKIATKILTVGAAPPSQLAPFNDGRLPLQINNKLDIGVRNIFAYCKP